MDFFTDIQRALDQAQAQAQTFIETSGALVANTLALDKLNEFDGLEVRRKPLYARRRC